MSDNGNLVSNRVERYIVDMLWLSKPFKFKVMQIIIPPEYYSSKGNDDEAWKQQLATIDFIYQESINQMFLILTTDYDEYLSKLDVVLNMEYYNHIPVLVTMEGIQRFKEIFFKSALKLALYIMNTIPRNEERAEFLLEGLTDTYAVITKHYNSDT